jgi:hypothetical protein
MSRSPLDRSEYAIDFGPRPRRQCRCGVTFVQEAPRQRRCRPCISGYGSQPKSNDERVVKYEGYGCSPTVWKEGSPPVAAARSELPPDTDPWAGRVLEPAGYEAQRESGETGPKRRARAAPLWTDAEVTLLREHYPAGRITRLLQLLPGRSLSAIQTKAHALGLRQGKREVGRVLEPAGVGEAGDV